MTAAVAEVRRAPERRAMPYNLDAEASILGGVIIRNESLLELMVVETDDFYLHQHKVVWEAIRNLEAKREPIDQVTLEAEIARRGKLDAIGGIAFLGELALRVPTPDNVIAYRDIVRRLSANRRAILALSEALESAYSWPHDPAELVVETAGRLQRIEDSVAPKRARLMTVEQALAEREDLARAPVYATPFETVNEALGFGGFLGTQVYTVAAGTGRGKTTLVSQVAAHSAETVPVLVVSYEMRPFYFVARKAAGVLSVHSNQIIRGDISEATVLAAMPYPRMFFMHKPTLRELRETVQYLADKYGTAPLVVVDYIQKLADEIALTMQRPDLRLATSQASATLCDIADRTSCALVAVSAIGRGKTPLKTPRKFEPYELVEVAKESGAVEYDGAGMIVLSLSKELDGEDRVATITIAKARFGQEMHIEARYNGKRGLWRDLGEVVDSGEAAPRITTPQIDDDEDTLRRKILTELNLAPAKHPTALAKRVKGNKQTALRLINRMLDTGEIVKMSLGLAVSPSGRQLLIEVAQ